MDGLVKTTCPRDCYDTCGIVVSAGSGQRVRVAGDPEHPVARGALCAKCGVAYNGVFQDPAGRLTTPLIRDGSGFRATDWDTVLELIASRLGDTIDTHGAESVLTMHYSGTMSLLASGFPQRFVNAIGASEVDYGGICNRAGQLALELLFGAGREGFDPRTAKDAACLLLWGANPAHTAPHAHRHWLAESPARVVVIDPVRTRTAADADLHLRPRPGTDAALAFALLNALEEAGALDQAFIDANVIGVDEILVDVRASTPEWAEHVTGVPAASIREAATLWAAGPAMLWCGQGLQRQPRGGNVMRAVGLLPALTGNVGKPGTGFYYVNGVAAIAGIDKDYLEGTDLRYGPAKTVGALELADRLADPDEFKAFLVWNTNPLASGARLGRLREASARDDLFMVAIDLFMTDTARAADVVLPAASFLEFDDLTAGYFHLNFGVQSKVLEPMGDALPNQTIFRRLAAAMGLDDPRLAEPDGAILEKLLEQAGYTDGFDGLRQVGTYWVNGDEPRIAFADLRFPTPSGRIEVASARAEAMGLPRVPRPDVDPEPRDGRLRLLTPASQWRLNDSYANDPRLARRAGPAELLVNPEDAGRFGITEGAAVRVESDAAAVSLVARFDEAVPAGTALSYKGRWPSLDPEGESVNALYDGTPNDMGASSGVHGTEVRLTPLT